MEEDIFIAVLGVSEDGKYSLINLADGHSMIFSLAPIPDKCCLDAAKRTVNAINTCGVLMEAYDQVTGVMTDPKASPDEKMCQIDSILGTAAVRIDRVLVRVTDD